MLEQFIQSIHDKRKIKLTFYSKQDNSPLVRKVAPMDYAPSSKAKDKSNRYHFWDYESDTANHTLSLLTEQIITMEFTTEYFEPSEFIRWATNWSIKRNWGIFS